MISCAALFRLALWLPTASSVFFHVVVSWSHELLWHPVEETTVESEVLEQCGVAHQRSLDVPLIHHPPLCCTALGWGGGQREWLAYFTGWLCSGGFFVLADP